MIRVTILRDGEIETGAVELLSSWTRESSGPLWVDITSASQPDIEPLLEEWFGFHELAAEDALSPNTLPKHDPFEEYDFFVFRTIDVDLHEHGLVTHKISAFLGATFLVTVHGSEHAAIAAIHERLPMDRRLLARGPDFLLHSILDVLVDAHFPAIDAIEDRLDEIQATIFEDPSPKLLDELLLLKRDLNILRRTTIPQRELFNQMSRGDARHIRPEHLIYFRDLYDHMYRIVESVDVERDLASSTMEAYLSVVANRTNEIMKVLTIFSAVLLPINLVASIYGMNFASLPLLDERWGWVVAIAIMTFIGGAMLLWFRVHGWIGRSETVPAERRRRRRRHRPSDGRRKDDAA